MFFIALSEAWPAQDQAENRVNSCLESTTKLRSASSESVSACSGEASRFLAIPGLNHDLPRSRNTQARNQLAERALVHRSSRRRLQMSATLSRRN